MMPAAPPPLTQTARRGRQMLMLAGIIPEVTAMNETLWVLFEIAVSVYLGLITLRFLCVYLDFDFKKPKNRAIYVTASLLFAAALNTDIFVSFGKKIFLPYFPVFQVCVFAILFLFVVFFLEGSVIRKLFICFLVLLCITVINVVMTASFAALMQSELADMYMVQNSERFLTMVVCQILLTFVYRLLLGILKSGEIKLRTPEWLLIIATFAISAVVFSLIHSVQLEAFGQNGGVLLILSEVGLVAINVVCVFMMVNLSKANKIRTENMLLKQQNEYRKDYAENTQKQYEETKRLRHDMKQNYNAISTLAAQGKYDKLKGYLSDLSRLIETTEAAVNTGNDIADAILGSKLSYAKNHGIKTLCGTVNDFAGIEDIDLCNLLGNMLDNAIEACMTCPDEEEKYLEVSISANNGNITVITKNTFNSDVIGKNPKLLTTKDDITEAHGFGIRTIRNIAAKYQGRAEFYAEEDLFCVCVTLCRLTV